MKYESPQLFDRIAAEYVLGTLRGAARRRFERLCATHSAPRTALHQWEDDFSVLSRSLEPVEPSAGVWPAVRRRIEAESHAQSRPPARWRAWQLAAAASVVAVGLIVSVFLYEPHIPLQTIAVLGPDSAHPQWRIERPKTLTALTIRVVGPVQGTPRKAYQLWALPRGGNPVSLGLMPTTGTLERALTPAQRTALLTADKIAVSVEPEGGSPTGLPTGPVIIVANLTALG